MNNNLLGLLVGIVVGAIIIAILASFTKYYKILKLNCSLSYRLNEDNDVLMSTLNTIEKSDPDMFKRIWRSASKLSTESPVVCTNFDTSRILLSI